MLNSIVLPARHGGGARDAIREMLFEAALVLMTHSRKWSWLKAWGMKIARHRGDEARDRRCGATAGGDHASHVGGWHRVSLDQERSCGHMTGSVRWWCASRQHG